MFRNTWLFIVGWITTLRLQLSCPLGGKDALTYYEPIFLSGSQIADGDDKLEMRMIALYTGIKNNKLLPSDRARESLINPS
jgi:hypothetical protein